MRITVQEFRRACDTVIEFTDQNEQLTDQQHRLVVTVVRSLADKLAPSSKPEEEESPWANLPLID